MTSKGLKHITSFIRRVNVEDSQTPRKIPLQKEINEALDRFEAKGGSVRKIPSQFKTDAKGRSKV